MEQTKRKLYQYFVAAVELKFEAETALDGDGHPAAEVYEEIEKCSVDRLVELMAMADRGVGDMRSFERAYDRAKEAK